ncbi:DUF3124 domain-containing protein [Desulfobacula sp.]|uniref:DUF3124 domain-containing protein n=1 Tax=Desulfobacula sp. TaxID=2593537 RepID=UPI00260F02C5|nr:DUF3124 domain-containing protein [Desulfobacula sp.]
MNNKRIPQWVISIMIVAFFSVLSVSGEAASSSILSRGQSVYVPVYSHIYHGNKEKPFNLTATLSIRNTNLEKDISLQSIDYFNSNGDLIRRYIQTPITLKKFATIRYIVKAKDNTGGSGAKFIVRWKSDALVNTPLIEAIMISTQSQQGISFVSRGQAIKE